MVDPNRKINRLTDKDIEFLDECEEEFADRFTEDDTDFMEHCAKPLAEPPIVENWGFGSTGHNNRGGGGGPQNHHGGGWNRRGRSSNDRGHRGGGYRNHNRRFEYRPYETSRSAGNDGGGGSRRTDNSDNRRTDNSGNRRTESSRQPPMNIRRDYGNFVPASKD